MRYQFRIDGRAAGPVRDTWEQAAHDVTSAGYGVWTGAEEIRLSDEAEIARVE